MPFDGLYLKAIKNEIKDSIGSRIDRINQPTKDEIIITFRKPKDIKRLLINVNSSNSRIHYTKTPPINPKTPPMFCMLLRKKLGGGRLSKVYQYKMDRMIFLEFETRDEIGDKHEYVMAIEFMGKHSNLIVYDKENKKIVDSIKRVNHEISKIREVYPNIKYNLPPMQSKLFLEDEGPDKIVDRICKADNTTLDVAIVKSIMGISPLVAREIAKDDYDVWIEDLDDKKREKLKQNIKELKQIIKENQFIYTMLMEGKYPKDFAAVSINQYEGAYTKKYYDSPSELLDYYFKERDRMARIKQQSGNLIKTVTVLLDRSIKKHNKRKNELKNVDLKEKYKVYGDLLYANLNSYKKGDTDVLLNNFYDGQDIKIKLDSFKTPVENAQHYYKEYKKSINADKVLRELILKSQEEIDYLESTLDFVMRITSQDEAEEIKNELIEQGYIKKKTKTNKYKNKKLEFIKYKSTDGYTILCGRNNIQNDKLTMKKSTKYDLWFHTQKIHGAHVVVKTEGKKEKIPDKTIKQAATIAAYNSKGRNSNKVLVDYTHISNVKKPSGSKPGMVIYSNFKTIIVNPDGEFVEKLKLKD